MIVNSLADAIEAQAGGAHRLEVIRDLDKGGLTPDLKLVQQIQAVVHIPIRVMLRENASMFLANPAELDALCRQAAAVNALGVDGLVAGFVLDDQVDVATLCALCEAAPQMNVTFHRAFDVLPDPMLAISALKSVRQVDRILTTGGQGSWPQRKLRLHHWQRCAAPEITILAGAGVEKTVISDLMRDTEISELHIGRAARIPQQTDGKVSRLQVAQIKGLLA